MMNIDRRKRTRKNMKGGGGAWIIRERIHKKEEEGNK
jgi:hypothetical protein